MRDVGIKFTKNTISLDSDTLVAILKSARLKQEFIGHIGILLVQNLLLGFISANEIIHFALICLEAKTSCFSIVCYCI